MASMAANAHYGYTLAIPLTALSVVTLSRRQWLEVVFRQTLKSSKTSNIRARDSPAEMEMGTEPAKRSAAEEIQAE